MSERTTRHPRPPRLKTDRELQAQLERMEAKIDALGVSALHAERLEHMLLKGELILMAISQTVKDALDALVADIDEKFNAANGPLIDELKAQVAALQAEDDIDQAEVDRLNALIATSEADTVAAIQSVKDHVDALGAPPA